jgi:hypothetical protein
MFSVSKILDIIEVGLLKRAPPFASANAILRLQGASNVVAEVFALESETNSKTNVKSIFTTWICVQVMKQVFTQFWVCCGDKK